MQVYKYDTYLIRLVLPHKATDFLEEINLVWNRMAH